jgi:chemotaxis protein CheC
MREVGNIGLGNAMMALSTMIDQGVNMAIPEVNIVPLSAFTKMAGGAESVSACVYMPVEGDAPGHVAFFLPEACARGLADSLMGQPAGTTQELDEISCSALMEVGNILASAYLVAIGSITGLNLLSSPPALAVDMTGAILSSIATAFSENEDTALTVLTRIGDVGSAIEGFFLYVPEKESLTTLFVALGLGDEMYAVGEDGGADEVKEDVRCAA